MAHPLKQDPHGYLFMGDAMALYSLTGLLWDIEGSSVEKERLLLVDAPRSVVYHGYGQGMYLMRQKSRVPFASFELDHGIKTVCFRYNDPMDPGSGRRKSTKLLTGWQGTAELIKGAVTRSKTWKNLETIEVESWMDHGFERVVYEVWATPVRNRTLCWPLNPGNYSSGAITFVRNQPEQIARVEVAREYVNRHLVEEVIWIEPYPQLAPSMNDPYGDYPNLRWLPFDPDVYRSQSTPPTPLFVDLSHSYITKIQPHDDLELDIRMT